MIPTYDALILIALAFCGGLLWGYYKGERHTSDLHDQWIKHWQADAKMWREKALGKKKNKKALRGFNEREIERLNELWEKSDEQE